jgi:hypothetical protein
LIIARNGPDSDRLVCIDTYTQQPFVSSSWS